MRNLALAVVLMSLAQLGCGASQRVPAAEVAKAKSQFEALDAQHKALNKTTDKRLRGITQSKLKPDEQYAFRRQALRKHSADARKLLVKYVRLANAQPQDKTAHLWTYAALVRGAFVLDDIGAVAGKRLYSEQGGQAEAAYFAGIAKEEIRGAYAGFMRVLFLGYHFHQVDVEDPTHTAAGNRWLTLVNTRRCELARGAKLTDTEQSNLTWDMFKTARPGQLHGSELRGQLMTFMKVPAFGSCK